MTGATLAADVVSNRRLSSLILGAGFGLTGAGTVMLGVLLPVLSRKWGLHDDSAGFLLFLQFPARPWARYLPLPIAFDLSLLDT